MLVPNLYAFTLKFLPYKNRLKKKQSPSPKIFVAFSEYMSFNMNSITAILFLFTKPFLSSCHQKKFDDCRGKMLV